MKKILTLTLFTFLTTSSLIAKEKQGFTGKGLNEVSTRLSKHRAMSEEEIRADLNKRFDDLNSKLNSMWVKIQTKPEDRADVATLLTDYKQLVAKRSKDDFIRVEEIMEKVFRTGNTSSRLNDYDRKTYDLLLCAMKTRMSDW